MDCYELGEVGNLGEEWQWPKVVEVADAIFSQVEDEDKWLVCEMTKMEEYIIENILEFEDKSSKSEKNQHLNFIMPNSISPILQFTNMSNMQFSVPPPPYEMRPISDLNNNYSRTSTSSYEKIKKSVQWSSLDLNSMTSLSATKTRSTRIPISVVTAFTSSSSSQSLFRNFTPSTLPLPTSSRHRKSQCGFCKKNGESVAIYGNHRLTDSQGRVECPQLRDLVCEICGATGDTAHTWSYCPSNTRATTPLPTLLRATPRQSDGKWRRRGGR